MDELKEQPNEQSERAMHDLTEEQVAAIGETVAEVVAEHMTEVIEDVIETLSGEDPEAETEAEEMAEEEAMPMVIERAEPDALSVGDFVKWNTPGGESQGRITRIERDGRIDVPSSSFEIVGTEDNPAALIAVYRQGADGWNETDVMVGHRFSALTKIAALRSLEASTSAPRSLHLQRSRIVLSSFRSVLNTPWPGTSETKY